MILLKNNAKQSEVREGVSGAMESAVMKSAVMETGVMKLLEHWGRFRHQAKIWADGKIFENRY